MPPGKLGWPEFAAHISEAANVPVESIEPGTRLLEDLGLDSLALVEVIVTLLVDLDMTSLQSDLAKREWLHVTVGELFAEYERGRAPARREQFLIRTQPRQ